MGRGGSALVTELRAMGVRAIAFAAKLGDASAADTLIRTCVKAFGGLDILVNSAGIWPSEEVPVHEMWDESCRRMMMETVDAMFRCRVRRRRCRATSDGSCTSLRLRASAARRSIRTMGRARAR